MTKTATDTRQRLLQRIADLEVKKQDAAPRAKGIYTVKIRKACQELEALDSARRAERKASKAVRPTEHVQGVWQHRVDKAIGQLQDGFALGVVYTCPTPKTATGTATKVRQMIASGKVVLGVGAVRVKSHGSDVVVVQA